MLVVVRSRSRLEARATLCLIVSLMFISVVLSIAILTTVVLRCVTTGPMSIFICAPPKRYALSVLIAGNTMIRTAVLTGIYNELGKDVGSQDK